MNCWYEKNVKKLMRRPFMTSNNDESYVSNSNQTINIPNTQVSVIQDKVEIQLSSECSVNQRVLDMMNKDNENMLNDEVQCMSNLLAHACLEMQFSKWIRVGLRMGEQMNCSMSKCEKCREFAPKFQKVRRYCEKILNESIEEAELCTENKKSSHKMESINGLHGSKIGIQQTSSLSKTAASELHELYVQEGFIPKYEFVQAKGADHAPMFECSVTVGNAVAIASAGNKQRAKQEAAIKMLQKLKASNQYLNVSECFLSINTSIDDTLVNSPKKESTTKYIDRNAANEKVDSKSIKKNSKNPIGRLQEVLVQRNEPLPKYELHLTEGPPHDRLYYMDCIVGSKYHTTGIAQSKNLAKRNAAEDMLKTLNIENNS